ncbi:MAG TPA: hypothetical protein VLD62_10540 [Acidimicrobiia bacterium]|nr:hypothetical protein [Acidimicrobiia bacterium]
MAFVIGAIVLLAVIVVAVLVSRRSRAGDAGAGVRAAEGVRSGRLAAPVAEFHVRGSDALVSFDVPLPEGEVDEVLRELLVREAVEVVREKRHTLPISEVRRVKALGRRNEQFVEVGEVSLDTPGELPPPLLPELIPHHVSAGFDPLDTVEGLPERAPGLAETRAREGLAPLSQELRLPGAIQAGLRAQGIDPEEASAGDIVLGIMRMTGYAVRAVDESTFETERAGSRIFLRVVPHAEGEHPELSEQAVRTFAVDFQQSRSDRGLLVTAKYSPFMIYDRERRDPRMRFITRERLQQFVDGLALG